jgi:hypothetical protein
VQEVISVQVVAQDKRSIKFAGLDNHKKEHTRFKDFSSQALTLVKPEAYPIH